MIDLDRLILRPALAAFSRPITYSPLVSQPGAPAFRARGVYDETPVDIGTEGDGIMSSVNITLGIRLSEFAVPPMQGDRLTIPAHLSLPAVGDCIVDNLDRDGNGGGILALKKVR